MVNLLNGWAAGSDRSCKEAFPVPGAADASAEGRANNSDARNSYDCAEVSASHDESLMLHGRDIAALGHRIKIFRVKSCLSWSGLRVGGLFAVQSLPVGNVEAAADDQRDAYPGWTIRKIGKNQISENCRTDDFNILQGCEKAGAAALEG